MVKKTIKLKIEMEGYLKRSIWTDHYFVADPKENMVDKDFVLKLSKNIVHKEFRVHPGEKLKITVERLE